MENNVRYIVSKLLFLEVRYLKKCQISKKLETFFALNLSKCQLIKVFENMFLYKVHDFIYFLSFETLEFSLSLDFKCPRDNLTEKVDFAGRQTALLVAKGPCVPYCNHTDGVYLVQVEISKPVSKFHCRLRLMVRAFLKRTIGSKDNF